MSTENITPASYTVFKDKDNLFKAKSQSGTILALGSVCQPVIQSAINAAFASPNVGGKVYIREGFYSGANINIPQKIIIEGDGFSTQLYGNVTISGGQDQIIRNLWINGNDSSGYALSIRDAVTTTVEDCKITQFTSNSGIAVFVDGGSNFGAINRFVRCSITADWRGILVPYSGFGVNSLQVSDSLFSWGNTSGDAGPLSGSIAIETAGHGLQKNFLYDNLYIERWDVGIRHDDAAFVARKIWIDACNQGIHVTSGAEAAGGYDIEVRTVTTQSGLVNLNGRLISGQNLKILPSPTIMSQIQTSGNLGLVIVAQSGSQEQIVRFSVPDDPNGYLLIGNNTAASGLFGPLIQGQGGSNTGTQSVNIVGDVLVGFDAGVQPILRMNARLLSGNGNVGTVLAKPVWQVQNNGVPIIGAMPGPNRAEINASLTFTSGASGISFSGMQRLPTMDQPAYVIWGSGTTYYALRTMDGQIVSSGVNDVQPAIQLAVDALIQGQAGGTIVLREKAIYPVGAKITLSGTADITIRGEGAYQTPQLRMASGTYPIFEWQANANSTNIRDLWLTHNNSGLSGIGLVQMMGGNSNIRIQQVHFYDFGNFKGDAIRMYAASGNILRNTFENIFIQGYESAIRAEVPSATYYMNDNSFKTVYGNASRYLLNLVAGSGAHFDGNNFIDCKFQWASGAVHAFDYETANSGNAWYNTHIACIAWDLASNAQYAVINNSTEIEMHGCLPTYRMSGAGVIQNPRRFRRWDKYVRNEGQFLGSGNAVATLFTFAHNLSAAPSIVNVTPGSLQAASGTTMIVSGGVTNINVTFTNAPTSGDLRINWSAQA